MKTQYPLKNRPLGLAFVQYYAFQLDWLAADIHLPFQQTVTRLSLEISEAGNIRLWVNCLPFFGLVELHEILFGPQGFSEFTLNDIVDSGSKIRHPNVIRFSWELQDSNEQRSKIKSEFTAILNRLRRAKQLNEHQKAVMLSQFDEYVTIHDNGFQVPKKYEERAQSFITPAQKKLIDAVVARNVVEVRSLLASGVDPDFLIDGRSPLVIELATVPRINTRYITPDDTIEILSLLILYGARPFDLTTHSGYNLLSKLIFSIEMNVPSESDMYSVYTCLAMFVGGLMYPVEQLNQYLRRAPRANELFQPIMNWRRLRRAVKIPRMSESDKLMLQSYHIAQNTIIDRTVFHDLAQFFRLHFKTSGLNPDDYFYQEVLGHILGDLWVDVLRDEHDHLIAMVVTEILSAVYQGNHVQVSRGRLALKLAGADDHQLLKLLPFSRFHLAYLQSTEKTVLFQCEMASLYSADIVFQMPSSYPKYSKLAPMVEAMCRHIYSKDKVVFENTSGIRVGHYMNDPIEIGAAHSRPSFFETLQLTHLDHSAVLYDGMRWDNSTTIGAFENSPELLLQYLRLTIKILGLQGAGVLFEYLQSHSLSPEPLHTLFFTYRGNPNEPLQVSSNVHHDRRYQSHL